MGILLYYNKIVEKFEKYVKYLSTIIIMFLQKNDN